MNKKFKLTLFIVLCLGVMALAITYVRGLTIDVLDPQGIIAHKQRNLIIFAMLLSLVVVIPVFIMTFLFAWKYRANNRRRNAAYTPDWDHSRTAETVWWLIPGILILILSVVTWYSSHDLDPYKRIVSTKKPITVQVVALQWKWLFIYPEQNIASVNFLQIPEDTPVNFEITADAPMNSFWIPQLGGQVYAMSGMSTKLHLVADTPGDYDGVSANLSGGGFADMKFTARAGTQSDFDAWVQTARAAPGHLTAETYNLLAAPSKDMSPVTYHDVEPGLYDTIVMKYMTPGQDATGASTKGIENHGHHH